MSPDDDLREAFRALRETEDGSHARPAETRARVLARALLARKRRRVIAAAVVPLAAAFVLSTAWAAVTGRLSRLFGTDETASTAPAGDGSLAPPPASEAAPLPSAEVAPVPTASATASASTAATAPSGAPSGVAATARGSSLGGEQALFDTAHRVHFVDRDPDDALRAWDAYLHAYPNGHFALEARYNRAITLVRLGRYDAARTALTPFAEGSYGGYRKNEARGLLDALGDGGGGP